jgi:hypothetical protein
MPGVSEKVDAGWRIVIEKRVAIFGSLSDAPREV